MSLPTNPQSRSEEYLNAIATGSTSNLPEPESRMDEYLDYIARNGGGGGGGTTVVANPTLAGTEADLTGLQVGDTKYKVPEGGGGGVTVLNYTTRPEEDDGDNYMVYTLDKTYAEILSAYQSGIVLIKATDYAFLSVIAVAGGVTSVPHFSTDYFDMYQADGMDSYPELWVLSPF